MLRKLIDWWYTLISMTSSQFRRKRGDTQIGSVEKQYGVDFGVRSNMKLSTYLKNEGLESLSKALKEIEKKK